MLQMVSDESVLGGWGVWGEGGEGGVGTITISCYLQWYLHE